jgi:hypothetical protein
MHLKAITPECKADDFLQVVKSALDPDILAALLSPILVDVKYVAGMSTLSDFFDQQLSLNGPSTVGRWVVANLEDLESWKLFQHGLLAGSVILYRIEVSRFIERATLNWHVFDNTLHTDCGRDLSKDEVCVVAPIPTPAD